MRISEKTSEDIVRDEAGEARRVEEQLAKEQIALSGLAEKTYQQAEDWIDEITTLASAKQKLKVMAKVILAIIKTR